MRKSKGLDYTELAKNIDTMREILGAAVAGLMDDGFTEGQARTITAGMFNPPSPEEDET